MRPSADSFMHPAAWNTLFEASWAYLPILFREYIRYIPTREYRRFRKTLRIVSAVANRLVEEKSEALLAGDQRSRDVMSVLGKHRPAPHFTHCLC